MPAGITERDGFFTVRGPAWHDLEGSHDLAEYPTRREAQEIAHNWEPVPEPVYRKVVYAPPYGPSREVFQEIPDQVLQARSDDGHPLGVVTTTFTPVTNSEM